MTDCDKGAYWDEWVSKFDRRHETSSRRKTRHKQCISITCSPRRSIIHEVDWCYHCCSFWGKIFLPWKHCIVRYLCYYQLSKSRSARWKKWPMATTVGGEWIIKGFTLRKQMTTTRQKLNIIAAIKNGKLQKFVILWINVSSKPFTAYRITTKFRLMWPLHKDFRIKSGCIYQ